MAIAYIAYERLQPAIRDRVDRLIELNPMSPRWTESLKKHVNKSQVSEAVFMEAATWPDVIANDSGYHDEKGASGLLAQSSGYDDKARHREWHVVAQPFSTDGSRLPTVATPNALTEIARMRQELISSTSSEALKSYDLTWLIHLVGDVHQPLHVATRVSQAAPQGDVEGTAVKLCGGCTMSLHDLWDSILGTTSSAAAGAALTKQLPSQPPAGADILDERAWAAEGLNLAKIEVYRIPIGPGVGPYEVTDTYRARVKQVASERVLLAGIRLAGVLNHDLR